MGHVGLPVLPREAGPVDRLDARRREPVGPLPAVLRAVDGAARLQGLVERAAPEAARDLALLARVAQPLVVRFVLAGARDPEGAGTVQAADAPDVERPEDADGPDLEPATRRDV